MPFPFAIRSFVTDNRPTMMATLLRLLIGLSMVPLCFAAEPSQASAFPKPLQSYPVVPGGVWETIRIRAVEDPFNVAASVIFLLAILHTFAAGSFTKWSHRVEQRHREGATDQASVSFAATILHFLGEVEAVFGTWVIALAVAAVYFHSWHDFVLYVSHDRSYTEPLFVFVIMAIAASRPVLRFAEMLMSKTAAWGQGSPAAWWLSVLVISPLLGSFITEPAAMTLGALLLGKRFYACDPPPRLAYATLGLLFVNVSVGGTLTHFAAPPVLMVAGKWGWDTPYMLQHFGWKALLGIVIATGLHFVVFRGSLKALSYDLAESREDSHEAPIPAAVTFVHLAFLAWTVAMSHYPALFIGGFLFFLAFTAATEHHQQPIALRGPLLVAFFLAGLVIHGGCQSWWIAPVMASLGDRALMFGSAVLTSFNDNAAITYLASQVDGLSVAAKHAVVAGAVAGGGLTVIANAPNPAGQALLGRYFKRGISPLGLFLGALIPTVLVYLCFSALPD